MTAFDPQLALAEMTAMEILVHHHLRTAKSAMDIKTCLLFATRLGTLKGAAEHAATAMRKERLCRCGAVVVSGKVRECPSCGRDLI